MAIECYASYLVGFIIGGVIVSLIWFSIVWR